MKQNSGQIVEFSVTDAAIATLAEKYGEPQVPQTTDEYEALKEGIKEVAALRIAVDKERKKQNAAALAHQRKVNEVGNGIIDRLKAIETPMKLAKAEVDEAEERRIREAEEAEAARLDKINTRIANIEAYGVVSLNDSLEDVKARLLRVEELDVSEGFDEFAKKAADTRATALENLKQGVEVLERQAKMDAERAELDAAREKIEAEQARIDAEKAEREAEERREKEKAQAEERRRLAELEKEKKERERLAEIEAENARRLALAPEKEKIMAYVQALRDVPAPVLESDSGKAMMVSIDEDLNAVLSDFESGADRL